MTLINSNVVASRHIKREEILVPVAARHSKTPELNFNFIRGNENVTHSAQGETAFLVEIFCLDIRVDAPRKKMFLSQTTYSRLANYRFSFRRLQILISQTTDFHVANDRFSFRFVWFLFAKYSKPLFGYISFYIERASSTLLR